MFAIAVNACCPAKPPLRWSVGWLPGVEQAGSPVRDEPGDSKDPPSPLFPHVYGPIPVSAVTGVLHAKVDRGRLTVESPEN